MKNLTIHWKGHYWNYDNVEEVRFSEEPPAMAVWSTDGKYISINFSSKEEQKQVTKRLEEGLINDYKFIELGE